MPNILTPISLWKNFDDSLPLMDVTLEITVKDGIAYESVRFLGRESGAGRVSVYGKFARLQENPSASGVLVIPDSCETVDDAVLEMFVRGGYSALMVDIRGQCPDCRGEHTVYPEDVAYANYFNAGRRLDYCDDSADKTAWYEWVSVGLYARKFLLQRLGVQSAGLIGIRDGGEVAWKLAHAGSFSCVVPVCAAGWRAYRGYGKFGGDEPVFDEERHRFIAAVDSQSYAPYVMCPVLMLCSTNDPRFDYDRAYDTFSRINPQYAPDSVIAYSIKTNACIGERSVKDMFMFLDKYVKERQVFISKPAELSISADEQSNLVARVVLDGAGEVEDVGVFMAEDCLNPVMRDWVRARPADGDGKTFYLDVYEKTSVLFAICYVTYTNGFTVWSKITVKKLSGTFRNSRPKSSVMYSSRSGEDCFSIADSYGRSVGGIFFTDERFFPAVIDCGNGLKGICSPCGLATYRMNSPRYMPSSDSVLKFDVFSEDESVMELSMTSLSDGEIYSAKIGLVGGVWQTVVLESKLFKSNGGKSLADFAERLLFSIRCPSKFSVNNVMWL